jgi:hypothetical protein
VPDWRGIAQRTIRDALQRTIGQSPADRLKVINKAYPFGERRMHPYKVWREEYNKARNLLILIGAEDVGEDLFNACPACGAVPGRPCWDYATRWEPGTTRPTVATPHAARLGVMQREATST